MPGITPDWSRVVIIPAYNAGPGLTGTIRSVLKQGQQVLLVDDGSNDGSVAPVLALAENITHLEALVRPANSGKGAAVLEAMIYAAERGSTHAAVFDADGQHDPDDLPRFMAQSIAHPEAMIMGNPIFGPEAPMERRVGHRLANFFARLETGHTDFGDSLFGLRVYPLRPALQALQSTRVGRGFDFDTQLAVRLVQAGTPFITLPARVSYGPRPHRSHFRYGRDNLQLIAAHASLLLKTALSGGHPRRPSTQ
jgi:glycosyltransferase involved in cell wall biosynthesis